MLELESLGDERFEDIVEAAKKQIAYLYPDWTDHGESDPGVTLIELLAWLKVLQQAYMDTVLDESRLKLLRLLGVRPLLAAPATATVTVGGVGEDCLLPRGSRFYAGDICFESTVPQWLAAGQPVRLTVRDAQGQAVRTVMPQEVRALAVFGGQPAEGAALEIGFDGPLPPGHTLRMALRLPENGPHRPKISPDDPFIPLCRLAWEYYGQEAGRMGWHPVRVSADETFGLLQSGVLSFSLPGTHGEQEGVFPLRVVMQEGRWDFPPLLAGLSLNAVKVCQRRTLCVRHRLAVEPGPNVFRLEDALAVTGRCLMLRRRGAGFAPAPADSYTLARHPQAGAAVITIEHSGEPTEYIGIFFETDLADSMVLGTGNGISFQRLRLPWGDIEPGSLSLLVDEGRRGDPQYFPWNQVEDFSASVKYHRHFVLEADGTVQFGDHVRGMAPRGGILLGGLALTLGAGGSVQGGRIDRLEGLSKGLVGATVAQPDPAAGGRDRESLTEAEARVPRLFESRASLVTEADYEQAVRTAPGLCIKNVKVLPGYLRKGSRTAAQSTVTLVVEGPDSREKGLPEAYRRNLERRIESMRLIGTQVDIISPEYIGIEVRGTVTLKPYFKDGPQTVLAALGAFIESLNGSFGQTLYYGDLFGFVDMLPCVERVNSLDIEPYGPYLEKTPAGDVRIPLSGGYFLRRTEIVFN